MAKREIVKDIYAVGVNDWDRRLFDELIPLPNGTSYNSYIIKGTEKICLIDTVDPVKCREFFHNLDQIDIDRIDYIVAHHAEQDHSGSIPMVLAKYPSAKVVTNAKCRDFLIDLLHLAPSQFIVINENDTLSLGNRTLKFVFTPWVHWPETFSSYLIEDKCLFSCDFFGAHIASSDLFADNFEEVYFAAKRYYAEIMMPFRKQVSTNIDKVTKDEISFICPSHGLVYRNPKLIIDSYRDWVSDKIKNEVIIPYISMHESTRVMVEHLVEALSSRGIKVIPFNLTVTDIGELAMSLVDAATIIIGTPTVLTLAHPVVVNAVFLANALRPKAKFASIIGSFGWGHKTVEHLTSIIPNLKVELIAPVMVKGLPKEDDLKKLDDLADQVTAKHREIGLF